MKVALKYYITDNSFKIITKNVQDGIVKFNKHKYYDVGENQPELYTRRKLLIFKQTLPCYTIHHNINKAFSLELSKMDKKTGYPLADKSKRRIASFFYPLHVDFEMPQMISPEKPMHRKMKGAVTPQNFKDMMTQGALNALLDVKRLASKDIIMYIIIGAVMGILFGLLLYPAIYG